MESIVQPTAMENSLWATLLSAVQAAVSVLLTIFYGVLAGQFGIMDDHSTKQMSKLCVQFFLPALLITNVGSQLNPENASQYAIIIAWSLTYTFSSLAVSILLQRLFKLPRWVTVTTSFNNTTSMPLLLTQTLATTGVLDVLLKSESDTLKEAVQRAQSYFLANAMCGNIITFTLGPKILNAASKDREDEDGDDSMTGEESHESQRQPTDERTSLLPRPILEHSVAARHHIYEAGKDQFQQLPPAFRNVTAFLYSLVNPTLIGGLLGGVLGLVPALHRVFFNSNRNGGVLNAWLVSSIQNIGELFAALQIVVVGVRLSQCLRRMVRGEDSGKVPLLGASITLVVRYVVWPIISIAVIYLLQTRTNWLSGDLILPFAMMLMPCGPSAMNLTSLTDVAGSSEDEKLSLAKFLTISYALSPLLSFAVVGSLRATQAAAG